MRRRRKLPPIPKDDGMVMYHGHRLVSPDYANRMAQIVVEGGIMPSWDEDPAYFWAEQVKAKKTMERKHDRT